MMFVVIIISFIITLLTEIVLIRLRVDDNQNKYYDNNNHIQQKKYYPMIGSLLLDHPSIIISAVPVVVITNNNNNNDEENNIIIHTSSYQKYRHSLGPLRNKISPPDYGGLFITDNNKRILNNNNNNNHNNKIDIILDYNIAEFYRYQLLNKWEEYDVDLYFSNYYDEIDYDTEDCVRPSWTYMYYPNCHVFHETIDAALTITNTTTTVEYINSGYYRDTWAFYHHHGWLLNKESDNVNDDGNIDNKNNERYVVKQLKYRHERDIKSLEKIRIEALIMERLTGSPTISKINGHCGTSTIVEMATDITYNIVPYYPNYMISRGRMRQSVLDELETIHHGPYPMNQYTTIEKLNLAIAMAESIAEQHGYVGSVIVNDDIHPDQYLQTSDGRYILNDMNNAHFLYWNNQNQKEYCHYWISYGGDFRAPEEYKDEGSFVDETVDIWPMGNLIFSLLTGLWPYYTETDEEIIHNITMQGIKPYLNPLYRTRSYIESRLIEIMDQCHVLEPHKRVTIFEVVEYLHETKQIYYAQYHDNNDQNQDE